jgi:GTP-binding protein Era
MTDTNDQHTDFKSGYVSIVGAPNAGKSTLLNRMLKEKISITSKKPQTTRNRILGVLIVDTALSALGDADLVLVVVDVSRPDPNAERYLVKRLKSQKQPVVLAMNKIDLIEKSGLLEIIAKWSSVYGFKDVVPISAQYGTQVEDLITAIEKILPNGPPFFPEDTLTDVSERFIVAELIREQVFRMTGEEIPYATAVTVDTFKAKKEGRLISIEATIHLERDSQKGIIIGKHGGKLKQIGTQSREQIEQLLGTKVFLKLFVRIQKNWRKDTKAIRRFGY